jgi:hypothetical protein
MASVRRIAGGKYRQRRRACEGHNDYRRDHSIVAALAVISTAMSMDPPPLDAGPTSSDRHRRQRPFLHKALRIVLALAYVLALVIVVKLVGKILDMP